NLRQTVFDLRTCLFHPGRETQAFTQLAHRFVLGESWRISGQFEKHATWFAKINRMKIGPIHNRADLVTETDQFFPPRNLFFIVRNAESNMVNRAGCDPTGSNIRSGDEINEFANSTFSWCDETYPVSALLNPPVAENLGQQLRGSFGAL